MRTGRGQYDNSKRKKILGGRERSIMSIVKENLGKMIKKFSMYLKIRKFVIVLIPHQSSFSTSVPREH